MNHKGGLFGSPSASVTLASSVDRKPLKFQNEEILKRVHRSTATSQQLASISINFTRRISDLKKAGLRIEAMRHLQTHDWTYRLIEAGGTATRDPATVPGAAAAGADQTRDLAEWFRSNRDKIPREPFELVPGVFVADVWLFYASIETDIDAGPRRARWHCGALSEDLHDCGKLLAVANPPDGSSSPQPNRQRTLYPAR